MKAQSPKNHYKYLDSTWKLKSTISKVTTSNASGIALLMSNINTMLGTILFSQEITQVLNYQKGQINCAGISVGAANICVNVRARTRQRGCVPRRHASQHSIGCYNSVLHTTTTSCYLPIHEIEGTIQHPPLDSENPKTYPQDPPSKGLRIGTIIQTNTTPKNNCRNYT